jgi:hypothetical protein
MPGRRGTQTRSALSDCGLDTMSDVNLAVIELLHDVHEIAVDDVRSGGVNLHSPGKVRSKCCRMVKSFACIPALVATTAQFPGPAKCCLGFLA